MDGIAIAAVYVVSPALGVSAAIAVAAHEIPQEVGDFGVLLDSGLRRRRALALNMLSATTAVPSAFAAYFAFTAIQGWLHVILAVSAASFLYVALADLVPHVREEVQARNVLWQVSLLLLGVGLIWGIRWATT